MSRESKIIVDQLTHDLQHRSQDFICNRNVLADTKTKIFYWITVDARVCYPYKMSFGWWQGRRLLKALAKWKANDILIRSSEGV